MQRREEAYITLFASLTHSASKSQEIKIRLLGADTGNIRLSVYAPGQDTNW